MTTILPFSSRSFAGLAGIAALGLLLPAVVAAQEPATAGGETTITIQKQVVKVSGRIGAGYLSGDVTESVYSPVDGRKLSELQWELEDVFMFNIGGSVTPVHWLTLNVDFWTKISDGNGSMDDYDWYLPNQGWTHWSNHPETNLSEGYMFDLNAAFTFYRHGESAFSGLVGYKRDSWEWEARGGSFVYSTTFIHDTVGTFPAGTKGITYSQWYDVPYVGLGFHSKLTDVSFMGRVIGSPFASANDKDTHHLRGLVYEDDFDTTFMYAFDLGMSYDFTPQLSLLGMVHYQKYEEAKGSTTITDQQTGLIYTVSGDVAGTDHTSSLFSLSVLYAF